MLKSKKDTFVAPEEAACNLIKGLLGFHSVAQLHCEYKRRQVLKRRRNVWNKEGDTTGCNNFDNLFLDAYNDSNSDIGGQ